MGCVEPGLHHERNQEKGQCLCLILWQGGGHARRGSGMLRVETITGLPSSPHVAVKLCLGGVHRVSGLSALAGWPGLVHPLRSLISTVLPVTATLPLPCHYPEKKNTWYCLVLCLQSPGRGVCTRSPGLVSWRNFLHCGWQEGWGVSGSSQGHSMASISP